MARGRNWSGLAMAVASGAAFGTSGVLARSLLDGGWSAAAAVTIRVAVAAVALTVPALLQLRGRWPLLVRNLPAVLAFGLVAVAGCQLAYFLAVSRLSVGVALLLEYSGVVLVVLWTWLRSRRRPTTTTLIGVAVAVGGLVLVLDVFGDVRVDPVGVVWGLVAAVGLAVYFVVSARTEDALPPLVTSWAGMAVGAVVLGLAGLVGVVPWVVTGEPVVLAGTRTSWLVPVLGLGLVAAALAYVLGVAAVQRLGARLASFVGLTEVLFAVLFAWLALGQQPGPLQLIGGAVVLAGIVLVRLGERAPEPVAEDADPVPVHTAGSGG
jgi:drug/metabolite transporter (DMT)-like permease